MRNCLLATVLFFVTFVSAQTKPAIPAAAPARLPVRRVVLYKNGVGYFEHSGRIDGNQELGISFTTAQLNDVLKSLTVVDLGEGRVTGIRYDSIAPLDVRLRGLRLSLGEQPTQEGFLNALRGSRVEVRRGTAVATGRVLSIESKTHAVPKSDQVLQQTELSLITETGELRTFTLDGTTSVRVLDKELDGDVNRYLNLIDSSRNNDVRRMVISDSGKGERNLFVSYISEVPIWKSTYRIVLRKDAKPLLQGWAIVDNTVGEDWSNVQLTLVAGSPQSFVQDISQPLYARRPVVPLPTAAMMVPQSHEGTMQTYAAAPPPPPPPPAADSFTGGGAIGGTVGKLYGRNVAGFGVLQGTVTDATGAVIPNAQVSYRSASGLSGSTRADSNGHYRIFNVPAGPLTLTFGAPGFKDLQMSARNFHGAMTLDGRLDVGNVSETIEVSAEATPIDATSVADAMESVQAEATGGDIGDLFQYDLKQPISIGKDQSALVPIINSRIEAEKVTLWSPTSPRPLRALWITNNSGLTLDSGTFNIVEDGAFSGEGLLEPVRPAERRLISYAADTAVRITSHDENSSEPISRIRIYKGILWATREERSSREYVVRNSDTTAREVVIEHPVRPGWKLTDGEKPEEVSASYDRFLVKVGPGSTAKLDVKEFRPNTTQIELSSISSDQITLYTEQKTITPEVEKSLRQVLLKEAEIGGMETDMQNRQQEINSISADQGRVRENMKALRGTPEERALVERYTRELNSQEDQLASLRSQIADLRKKKDAASNELDSMIMAISFDEGE